MADIPVDEDIHQEHVADAVGSHKEEVVDADYSNDRSTDLPLNKTHDREDSDGVEGGGALDNPHLLRQDTGRKDGRRVEEVDTLRNSNRRTADAVIVGGVPATTRPIRDFVFSTHFLPPLLV